MVILMDERSVKLQVPKVTNVRQAVEAMLCCMFHVVLGVTALAYLQLYCPA